MKEILESKVMVFFALFVIGFCYFAGCRDKELDKQKDLHQIENNASQVISK